MRNLLTFLNRLNCILLEMLNLLICSTFLYRLNFKISKVQTNCIKFLKKSSFVIKRLHLKLFLFVCDHWNINLRIATCVILLLFLFYFWRSLNHIWKVNYISVMLLYFNIWIISSSVQFSPFIKWSKFLWTMLTWIQTN